MTHDQIAARLRTLRDRTGDAVCLDTMTWFHVRASACASTEYRVWIGAHREHYSGATAEEALSEAEDACLFATSGDGT